MILDTDALHVLTAYVKNAVDIRIEELGSIIVGDGLDLSLIEHERGFDQGFTVACGAGTGNCNALRHMLVDFLNCVDRCLQRISVVRPIGRIEKLAIFRNESCLGRRAAGVYAKVCPVSVLLKIALGHLIAVLTFFELLVRSFVCKKRCKT